MKYKNVALITGASSGIGKELAHIHAWRSNDLVIIARRKKELETLKIELEKEFKIKVYIIVKDLSIQSSSQEIYDELKKENIKVKYLINNAGFGGMGSFHEQPFNTNVDMIMVNIVALTNLTRLFLPDFVKKNEGKILNVSSVASLFPGPMHAVYFATKAYVTSFSNALYSELSTTKITVTNLLPSFTETEFGKIASFDNLKIFQKGASAKKVAVDGYDGMIKGKLNVYGGVKWYERIFFWTIVHIIPKKIVLFLTKKKQTK